MIFFQEIIKNFKYRKRLKKVIRIFKTKELNLVGKCVYFFITLFGKEGLIGILIISIVLSSVLMGNSNIKAATFTWNQTSWADGLDGGINPNHNNNQENWQKYSAKDSDINILSNSIKLNTFQGSSTQGTDTDFNLGTHNQTSRNNTGTSSNVTLLDNSIVPVGTWDSPSMSPSVPTGSNPLHLAYPGSGDLIYDGRNTYSISNNAWTNITSYPVSFGTGGYGFVYPGSGDYFYTVRGNSSKDFYRYQISGNSWSTVASTTEIFGAGGGLVSTNDGNLYGIRGNNSKDYFKYSISSNTWTALASTTFGAQYGSAQVYLGSGDYIYATMGNSTKNFLRYSITGNNWTGLADTPNNMFAGASIVYPGSGDFLYVTRGDTNNDLTGRDFYRYSISGNTWTALASTSVLLSPQSSMVYPGSGDYIYLTQGEDGKGFWKYSISRNVWINGISSLPFDLDAESAFFAKDEYVYVKKNILMAKYSVQNNLWTSLGNSPANLNRLTGSTFVYPETGDFAYFNVGSSKDFYRYNTLDNSWLPLASSTLLTPPGTSMTGVGTDSIYQIVGSSKNFYKYSITNNLWTPLASSTVSFGSGGSQLVYPKTGDFIYATLANNTGAFYKYSISGNSWSPLTSLPSTPTFGASLTYPGSGNYIYATTGGHTNKFYRYSITNDTWTELYDSPASIFVGSVLIYPNSGNYIYLAPADSTNYFYRYSVSASYYNSGDFTSSAINLGQKSVPTTLLWSSSTTTSATVKFKIRSSPTLEGLSSSEWYGPTGTGDYYTISGQNINSIHSGDRYFQYKAFFETSNINESAVLDDVTINYNYYPLEATITSSAYNTLSSANVVSMINWSETAPVGSDIKFQIRTAPDNSGSPGAWTSFVGPDGTSGTYFSDSTGSETTPNIMSDGVNDQWIQYKIYLVSTDGTVNPELNDVTLTYVVNISPDFDQNYPTTGAGGASATQNANGNVTINYSIKDSDTDTGSISRTRGYVTPSFEYSLNSGSTWNTIPSQDLGVNDLQNKAVSTSTYTSYSATWSADNTIPNVYSSTVKIRVTVNDNEAANNSTSTVTSQFSIDAKPPTLAAKPFKVDASVVPAQITLSVTDDSVFEMKIGKTADLSDASYESYSSSKTITVSASDIIYAQFKDTFGNETAIISSQIPITPSNFFFQDTSNPVSEEWREFFAWGVISSPTAGFKRYNIYRSENEGPFTLLTTVSNRLVNYIVDTGLSSNIKYSYKVSAEDLDDNISLLSPATLSDFPDGVGGSDLSSPVISSVDINDITTAGATITWTTNKISNSNIYYLATTTYPGTNKALYENIIGIPSMVNSHSVILSGLIPSTKYYFLVESQDSSENIGTSANELFTFTTETGPIISNVTASQIFDNEADITWNTDVPSDSTVYYSVNSNMSGSVPIYNQNMTTDHKISLTNLTQGTKYYYYVSSVDGSSNSTTNKNIISGTINYFSFNTTSDGKAPSLSNISTALIGESGSTITWSTDEPSTSQVEWGITPSLGTFTTETNTYTNQHAVVLSGLSTSTKYYYKVISKDKSLNISEDDNGGNRYTFTTLAPTTYTNTEIITKEVYIGGGGGGIMDNRDLTKPVISDIKVEAVGGDSAVISFKTSKIANGLINYGETILRGSIAGRSEIYGVSHVVTITGLKSETLYHFVATSSDIYGNSSSSEDMTFVTLESGKTIDVTVTEDPLKDITNPEDISLLEKVQDASAVMVKNILLTLSSNQNLANVSESDISASISELTSKISSSPAIFGEDIKVEIGSRSAKISWTTDKKANSLVSYASASEYKSDPNKAYAITAGSPDEKVTKHVVKLNNLLPSTTYHYQIRSQSSIGPVSLSVDKTFTTASLIPEITNIRFDEIGENSATVKWNTDLPTKTNIEVINTDTGETKKDEELNYLKEHTYQINELDISTGYSVKIVSTDSDGNSSSPSILPFVTVLSTDAPKISNIKVTSSIVPDRMETVQTIISWKTDKPSTSKVYYGEGVSKELKQSISAETGLVRDHIIITTVLHPGSFYKISVESNDSGGNITRSSPYTILTPKSKDSVIDIIFKNFEQTFGFLKGK